MYAICIVSLISLSKIYILVLVFNLLDKTKYFYTSCSFGDPLEVHLLTAPDSEGSGLHKILQTQVINSSGGQNYIGSSS